MKSQNKKNYFSYASLHNTYAFINYLENVPEICE